MGRYTRLRNLKYLLYPFFLSRLVARSARGHRFDVILSQHTIAAVSAGKLKRRLNTTVVMNFLDFLTGFMETWPQYLAPRALIRSLGRYELRLPKRYAVDGVMTVSDPLADWIASTGYPRDRIRPIYYGYDSARFKFREPPEVADESPVVVMHGSFDHHHLGPIALNTVKNVAAVNPNIRFRFVGRETPALQRFVQRVSAQVPRKTIESTGFVPYAEVAERLRGAQVGWIPYEESNGTHCAFVAKAVEFIGLGIPVASTPLLNLREYFADEALIRFSRFDGESLSKVILGWLAESADNRRTLARAGAKRVASRLDWRVLARNAVDFVEQTVERSPWSPSR
jgi:glycosyltransferase involved in cell wall biosynthesis